MPTQAARFLKLCVPCALLWLVLVMELLPGLHPTTQQGRNLVLVVSIVTFWLPYGYPFTTLQFAVRLFQMPLIAIAALGVSESPLEYTVIVVVCLVDVVVFVVLTFELEDKLQLYALGSVIYGVATFKDCPAARDELKTDFAEAKRELRRKGFTFCDD